MSVTIAKPEMSDMAAGAAAAPRKRGDLALLAHPVARELLQSTLLARLAYIARDGTPRVAPMQFHWTGEALVVNSWPDDPKVAALRAHADVAVSIDTDRPPFRALQLRGSAEVRLVDGVSEELALAAARYLGPEGGREWVALVSRLSPQSARIAIRPTWADVLDFEARLPGGMARRVGTAGSGGVLSSVT